MTQLLKKIGILDDDGVLTWYWYDFIWSDCFHRSWVKHKFNGVLILTIISSNPNGDELSLFHTHIRAIGKGHTDHTAVMDWYADETKELL